MQEVSVEKKQEISCEEKQNALAELKSVAPQLRGILAPQQEYCRILIDGYYGDHADMTASSLEQMSKKALDLIQNHWKIPLNHIIWICTASTWMKSIPLILMQQGFGHAIEFYFPCHWRLKNDRLVFYGREGQIITRSMDFMRQRLAESKSVAQCEIPHLSTQLKDCILDLGERASMFYCDGFPQQRSTVSRASTHMIYFPHITPTINASTTNDRQNPGKIDNDAYYNQGGRSYEEKPSDRRLQVNIYKELRTCNLQGRTLVL